MKERITTSAVIPVTLQDMRDYVGITRSKDTESDTNIENALLAAHRAIETFCRIAIGEQTRVRYIDTFGDTDLSSPVQQIIDVKYRDEANVLQTMPITDYYVDLVDNKIFFDNKPLTLNRPNVIEITYTCGLNVEPGIIHAIKILTAHMVKFQRNIDAGTVTNRPYEIGKLIEPFKDYRGYFVEY